MKSILLLPLALLMLHPALGLDIDSGLTPQHAVMTDFNRDGLDDVAVANAFDDRVNIHLQNSQGAFPLTQSVRVGINPSTPSNFPRFLLVEDINRDRCPDLIVLCSGQFSFGAEPSVQTLLNDRSGDFERISPCPTTSSFTSEEFAVQFARGEFTGDHYPDLAICNLDGRNIRIIEGGGTGLFEVGQRVPLDIAGEGPQDLAVFDGDRDGLDDLWVVTAGAFVVLRQTVQGTFSGPVEFPLLASPTQLRGVVLQDFDGDGGIDAALADAEGRVHRMMGIEVSGTAIDTTVLTDPSLSGCSDIVGVLWDTDSLPDIAVTNRTGDTVSILLSMGGTRTYPTGMSPRRIEAVGDFDGDGRSDLVVAAEGDASNPGNPDVTLIPNLEVPVSTIHFNFESEWDLEERFDLSVPAAQGMSIPEDRDHFWLIDSTRRILIETESDGEEERRVEIPFEIGGVHFTDEDECFLIERGTSRIHRLEIESDGDDDGPYELETVADFEFDPGETGFSGLAYDEEQKEFFVSAPGLGKTLRLDEDGNILSEIETEIPAWDLAWNENRNRLLAVNPGRSEVRAYSRTGTLDAGLTVDLSDTFGLFGTTGIAGISWDEEENKTFLLTTSGTLFDFSTGVVSSPISTAPSAEMLGMDFSIDRNEIYALNSGGFFIRMRGAEFEEVDLFSVWPAVQAYPDFHPIDLSYDANLDEILIVDRNTPLAARFSHSGNFLGYRDFTPDVGSINSPILDFDLIDTGFGVCFRTASELIYGPPSESFPMAISESVGLSWTGYGLFLSGANEGEVIHLESPESRSRQRIEVQNSNHPLAIAPRADGSVYLLNGSFSIQSYTIDIQSGNENWNLYE